MELFHEIPDGAAIIRMKHGLHKQAKIYRRSGHVYIGVQGGFVRIMPKFGNYWPTANPNITVVDITEDI